MNHNWPNASTRGNAERPGKPGAVGDRITQHTPVVSVERRPTPSDAAAVRRAAGRK